MAADAPGRLEFSQHTDQQLLDSFHFRDLKGLGGITLFHKVQEKVVILGTILLKYKQESDFITSDRLKEVGSTIVHARLTPEQRLAFFAVFRKSLSPSSEIQLRVEWIKHKYTQLEQRYLFERNDLKKYTLLFDETLEELKILAEGEDFEDLRHTSSEVFQWETLYLQTKSLKILPVDGQTLTSIFFTVWQNKKEGPTKTEALRIKAFYLEDMSNKSGLPEYKKPFDEMTSIVTELVSAFRGNEMTLEQLKLACESLHDLTLSHDNEEIVYSLFLGKRLKPFALELRCKRLLVQYAKLQKLGEPKEENQKQYDEKFDQVKANLQTLAERYKDRSLPKDQWDILCDKTCALTLPTAKQQELIDIFLNTKQNPYGLWESATYLPGAVLKLPTSLSKYIKSLSTDGEATWKGEKYVKIVTPLQEWVKANEERNAKWLNKQKDFQDLRAKVEALLKFLKEVKFPVLPNDNPSLDERKLYNEGCRTIHEEFLTLLREAFSNSDYPDALRLFVSFPDERIGSIKILKEICKVRFTKTNLVSFIMKLMRDMVPLGLQKLAETETCYRMYLNQQLYPNPLLLPLSLQREAIDALPQEFKAPLIHMWSRSVQNAVGLSWDMAMMGNPAHCLFALKVVQYDGTEKEMSVLRFGSPTMDDGGTFVDPVFRNLLEFAQTAMFSLQKSLASSWDSVSKQEAARNQALLKLNNSTKTFVSLVPISQSALFKMKGKYSDPAPLQPCFKTFAEFKKVVMEEVTKGCLGGFVFRQEWLKSDRFIQEVEKSMDDVHYICFDRKQGLLAHERRIFMKIFIAYLALRLCPKTQADLFAFFCNYSADRTVVFLAITQKIVLVLLNKEKARIYEDQENSPTWEENHKSMATGIPLVTVKRSQNHNHGGMVEALAIFDDPEVQKRLQEFRDLGEDEPAFKEVLQDFADKDKSDPAFKLAFKKALRKYHENNRKLPITGISMPFLYDEDFNVPPPPPPPVIVSNI